MADPTSRQSWGGGGCHARKGSRDGMSERSPARRLDQARRALQAAERAEAAERATLAALLDQERQNQYALEQAASGIRTSKGADGIQVARARAVELEKARHVVVRARHDQEEAVKACQGRTRDERISVEALEQRAARLHRAVRQAERLLVTRQRAVLESEGALAHAQEELARTRRGLDDAQAALDALRRELREVDDPAPDSAPRRTGERS